MSGDVINCLGRDAAGNVVVCQVDDWEAADCWLIAARQHVEMAAAWRKSGRRNWRSKLRYHVKLAAEATAKAARCVERMK